VILRLPVQSPNAGLIQTELDALSEIASTLIAGNPIQISEVTEVESGKVKVTAAMISHNLREYLFSIEEEGDSMRLSLHSMDIELMISLPSPLIISFDESMLVGELC
jgi:hypothetical protein